MPLPKYYCDYCDKQFQDTASARKRHLQGLQHQRAKALWYDSFKDPSKVQDGFGRGVCNHFVRTGFCQFGDSCKYFHPRPNVQHPNAQVANFVEYVNVQSSIVPGNQFAGGGSTHGKSHYCIDLRDAPRDGMGITLGNLPPSLRPPPEGGYPHLPFVDWG